MNVIRKLLAGIQGIWKRYKALPKSLQWILQVLAIVILLLIAPGGKRMLWPIALLLFWGFVSLDNRTLTNSSLLFFFLFGFLGLPLIASTLETPLAFIFADNSSVAGSISVGLETSLLLVTLVAVSVGKNSRLRYTGTISDFILAGLALGVGSECALSCLIKNAPDQQGLVLGLLPQWPGLLGSASSTNACTSPLMWGMGLGLLVGLARYNYGPDFHRIGSFGRELAIALAVVVLSWLALERFAFLTSPLSRISEMLYGWDLRGRLFMYTTIGLTVLTLVVEWMVIQEQAHNVEMGPLAQTLEKALDEDEAQGLLASVWNAHRALVIRRLLREQIIANEVRPLLPVADQTRLAERLQLLEQWLAKWRRVKA